MADGAANPLPVPTGASKTPSDFLKSIKGKPVLVKLNSGVDYRGGWPQAAYTALAARCNDTRQLVPNAILQHLP